MKRERTAEEKKRSEEERQSQQWYKDWIEVRDMIRRDLDVQLKHICNKYLAKAERDEELRNASNEMPPPNYNKVILVCPTCHQSIGEASVQYYTTAAASRCCHHHQC